MTPLAHFITKQLTYPVKDRIRMLKDNGGFLPIISEVHCFECSALSGKVDEFFIEFFESKKRGEHLLFLDELNDEFGFLPAPKTWLEQKAGNVLMGFLLEEVENHVTIKCAAKEADRNFASTFAGVIHLPARGIKMTDDVLKVVPWSAQNLQMSDSEMAWAVVESMCLLSLINSPKVIGRHNFAPHRGLQKALTSEYGERFKLKDWTEIHIKTGEPRQLTDNLPGDGYTGGRKCLHFVRKFRRCNGQIVRSHWRGDAALGINQSRYLVEPGEQPPPPTTTTRLPGLGH